MRSLVVAAVLAICGQAQDLRPGLVATYSGGGQRVRTIAPAPDFYLEAPESVHPALPAAFEAEYEGVLTITQAGDYTFARGAAELSIDGAKAAGPMRLTAGRHPIRLRYRRAPGASALRLDWSSPAFPREPVPASVLSHEAAKDPSREETLVERGRDLVEEFGCVNCHKAASPALEGRLGPDLTGVGSRVNPAWLYHWLGDPTAFRAGAMMPALADEQKRRDVASYLASLKSAEPGPTLRRVQSHESASGSQLFGALGCAACHSDPGLWLEGMGSKTTLAPLTAFLMNPAKTDPGGRMPSLLLSQEEALQIAAYLLESRNDAFEKPAPAGDAARGKTLVASEGCLACHALSDGGALENRQRAKRIEELADGGCLAANPAPGVPHYHLSADQRDALRAFLASYRQHPDVSRAPLHRLARDLRELRCVACHETDAGGPTATLAEKAPPLTEVGAKLRTAWIAQVVAGRTRVRGWTDLRMPEYDARRVRPMVTAFAKAAGVAPGDGPASPPATDAVRATGVGMIGTDAGKGGMACIGCHDWGEFKSQGEDGPQLINAARRLRYDWYYRWMLNPARILSGTSMPGYFVSMDRRRASEKINALWAALEWGEKMPPPDGARRITTADPEAHPSAGSESVVVRWDMPEATPAAIAVGMPGGVSYCFDAGEVWLRYAWTGGFIDLAETLHRKTDPNKMTPTARIVGRVFYRADGFPWRVGAPDRVPQRRFRGYRMVKGYPELRYQIDGIDVSERITTTQDHRGIVREFTIARVDQPVWVITGAAQGTIEVPRGTDVKFSVTIAAPEAGR